LVTDPMLADPFAPVSTRQVFTAIKAVVDHVDEYAAAGP